MEHAFNLHLKLAWFCMDASKVLFIHVHYVPYDKK